MRHNKYQKMPLGIGGSFIAVVGLTMGSIGEKWSVKPVDSHRERKRMEERETERKRIRETEKERERALSIVNDRISGEAGCLLYLRSTLATSRAMQRLPLMCLIEFLTAPSPRPAALLHNGRRW